MAFATFPKHQSNEDHQRHRPGLWFYLHPVQLILLTGRLGLCVQCVTEEQAVQLLHRATARGGPLHGHDFSAVPQLSASQLQQVVNGRVKRELSAVTEQLAKFKPVLAQK